MAVASGSIGRPLGEFTPLLCSYVSYVASVAPLSATKATMLGVSVVLALQASSLVPADELVIVIGGAKFSIAS